MTAVMLKTPLCCPALKSGGDCVPPATDVRRLTSNQHSKVFRKSSLSTLFDAPRSVAIILGVHQNLMKHPIITHRGALPSVRAHVAACIIVIYGPCVCLKCVTESHETESTIKNLPVPLLWQLGWLPGRSEYLPSNRPNSFCCLQSK